MAMKVKWRGIEAARDQAQRERDALKAALAKADLEIAADLERLKVAEDYGAMLYREIDGLAKVLVEEYGGPTQADERGACSMAVRVLQEQRAEIERLRAALAAPAPE